MLIRHIIILLLSWRLARAIEDEKPPPDDVFDQIATASENHQVSTFNRAEDPQISLASTKKATTPSAIKAATIHYENSNGFIPMTSMEGIMPESSEIPEISTAASDEQMVELIDSDPRELGLIENDPAYSTEARMFLNLAGPSADRRSFDAQDGQSEFEILKVNKETPAIANYHDFYENMQSNLSRNRGGTQDRNAESKEPAAGRTSAQNKRTKDRIKKIEKYLTNFHGDRDQEIVEPYKQYYNSYSGENSRPTSRQKEIFEPEKVQTNFHQQSGSSIHDVYGDTPTRQRTSSMLRSNYDDSIASPRQKYPGVSTKNRHSKPVVVVETSGHKVDAKYGTQQVMAKVPRTDHHRNQKHQQKEQPELKLETQYDEESLSNREDRYDESYERSEDIGDYTEEADYLEITEKPRRIHKSRRRPQGTENSRRLPKEHRGQVSVNLESEDSRKSNSLTRSKLHRPKAKPSYWIEEDRETASEENFEEQTSVKPSVVRSKTAEKSTKQHSRVKETNNWSQVGPNIEVSHSNGYEIGQIDKPKLLVPVNLNLLPLTNFDHSTAVGNSQGFDFTNVPNFVTAAPIVSSQSSLLSTGQSVVNFSQTNSANTPKTVQNSFNNNYGLSNSVPDIIVGQNTYHNPVQTVIMPHMNVHNKFPSNLRSHYSPSTVAPIFTVTQSLNPNPQSIVPTMTSVPLQNFQATASPRTINSVAPNFHHLTVNQSPGVPQLLLPQPTLQTYPLLHAPYNGNSNYNILVNPIGLNGQNLIRHGGASQQSVTGQNSPASSTTPQPNTGSSNNLHSAETQVRKNSASNSNAQFVTTASLSVGSGEQQGPSNVANNNNDKYYVPANNQNPVNNDNNNNNNNNNNYFNGNQNGQQVGKPQQQESFYHIYRDDQNPNGKIKTYIHTAQVVPAIIHNGIPVNLNGHNYANVGEQLQEQQSMLNPSIVAHRPRDQNQQILKAANDIFENTWKQLRQLQSNDDAARRLPYQNVYRIGDNIGSTSNTNDNTANALPGVVNTAKAQLPIMATQNVEILNPNIKPSPVDLTLINPYENLGHYPAAVLTTQIPIFSTATNFLAPRPIIASTTPGSMMNLQNYVGQLTQYGAQSNQVNKIIEQRPGIRSQENQRQLFNPINFVPNIDLMKSQTMLNNKHNEPLPNQLNLVPLIPGGNFFKNTYGAQTELVQKPRLSTDLEKYAEEMLKESLKTIYSTHKWNNDGRSRGNYSSSELNDLLKSELQRYKASVPDSKHTGKDILEAHHSETKVRTAEPSTRPGNKKPELTIAEIEQLFKSDFKLSLPTSSDSSHHGSHHKNRPVQGHGSSRPGASNEHSNDFRNIKQLTDYLTPPKVNSFISKSPFIDVPKPSKKRPVLSGSRYNSASANSRPLPRPSSLVSRPATSPDASASNHVESGPKADSHNRYEKYQHRPGQYYRDKNEKYEATRHSIDHTDYRSYPTFTTTSSPDNDISKASSNEQYSKTDYYDINHPRMHNLMGLLMKNKQLPRGSSQSLFRNEDDLRQYFDNEKRRIQSEFYDDNGTSIQKKSDTPVNMDPPAPPNPTQIRYYSGRGAA